MNNVILRKTFWKHVLQQGTISSKTSRVILCIFERTFDEHSIYSSIQLNANERAEIDDSCTLSPSIPSCNIVDSDDAFFYNFIDVSVVARIYLYIAQMCSQYVSESFVCSEFYIDADLTDLRKNSNNPISLFLAKSGLYWEILNWLPHYRSWHDTW